MSEKPIFEVRVAFVYSTPEGARERSLSQLFRAEDSNHAILAGLRWAKNREASMNDVPPTYGIGCVKVHGHSICAPDKNGYIASGTVGCWYEWKCDRGTTFEQELEQAVKKTEES